MPKKPPPFPFVLEMLEDLELTMKPMFGCLALYYEGKIVLILREREDHPDDNGVWVATTAEHHASLRAEIPILRSIKLFGPGETGWQNLPATDPAFEMEVEKVIKLVRKRDPRIGKIPKPKPKPKQKAKRAR